MRLNALNLGKIGKIRAISNENTAMEAKLREIGFAEHDEVEMLHTTPLGKSAVCVRLNQTMIGLRYEEAALIEVET